jgi:type VI secretion system secreted protein VgrG
MATLSQSNRTAKLKTPLGEDVLVLKSFSGSEGLGELFEFQIDALSEQENLSFDRALGQNCTIELKTYEDKTRYFCGILSQSQWVGSDEDYYAYRLVLRPWFWLLDYRANCRIFLDKKVTEIIQDVFEKAGYSSSADFKSLKGSYDKIEYCVQYRETDFAFVSRLMEQYGIYYFFEHRDGQHTMVLADAPSSHQTIPDLAQVRFNPQAVGHFRQEQHIHSWISDRRFGTARIALKDYNYLKPPNPLNSKNDAHEGYNPKYEVFDYPGKYDEQDKGDKFAQFRLEAEQALDHRRLSNGDAPSIFSGGAVKLDKHPTTAENQDYLVVTATHSFGTQNYSSRGIDEDTRYSGTYEFQPKERPYRSLAETPKPRIYGIQTAKVVAKQGEDGEEISTDEHGRIWVKFFWDREPQKTCPIRVAQVWASKRWGGQFIPRIDMEVVVEFLEGDPDRPLVTGAVFNGDNKYPYTLPDNKTQSGLKSDSSKGHNGYNEFMFEDKKGSEDIRMHAEKDHDVTIRNKETITIGEIFSPSNGSASRDTTLLNGDDQLFITQGDHVTMLAGGNQTTTLGMGDQSTVLGLGSQETMLSTGGQTTILPLGAQTTATMMTQHSAALMITHQAGVMITLQAPIIHLQGVVIMGAPPIIIPGA